MEKKFILYMKVRRQKIAPLSAYNLLFVLFNNSVKMKNGAKGEKYEKKKTTLYYSFSISLTFKL